MTCATIGCRAAATHTIDIELGPEPICSECAAGYMRRPAVMKFAVIERIAS